MVPILKKLFQIHQAICYDPLARTSVDSRNQKPATIKPYEIKNFTQEPAFLKNSDNTDIEEAVSNSPDIRNEAQTDVSHDMETKGHVGQLESSPMQEKKELELPIKTLDIEGNTGNMNTLGLSDEVLMRSSNMKSLDDGDFSPLKSWKDEAVVETSGTREVAVAVALPAVNSSKDCSGEDRDRKSYLCNEKTNESQSSNTANVFGIELTMDKSIKNNIYDEDKSTLDPDPKTKPMEVVEDDRKRKASRLVDSEIRSRSLSHGLEVNHGNKRPALICSFFAKGWCIRGSSCNFLHVKDNVDCPENVSPSTTSEREELGNKLSEIDALAKWDKQNQITEGLRRNTAERSKLSTFTDQQMSMAGNFSERIQEYALTESQKQNQLDKNHSYPFIWRDDFSHFPSNIQQLPSSKNSRELFGSSGERYLQLPSLNLSRSLSSKLRFPLSSCSSTFNASQLNSRRQMNSDREYSTFGSSSLLQSASHFRGSEHALSYAERKAIIFSYNWEPSVPFRPSMRYRPSSSGNMYNPLLDGIELLNSGDRLLRPSSSHQRSREKDYEDPALSATSGPECGHKTERVRNYLSERSVIFGAEAVGTSMVDVQKETMTKDENTSGSSHFKNPPKKKKTDINYDAARLNVSRHKNDLPVEKAKLKNGTAVGSMVDEEVDKESKSLRHFRGVLIDYVKELLKPTWRSGLLSKDAHNMIVKKSVEKVLSTMQPEQIPPNMESAKQYLSFSQSKISTLVEAYSVKYGKS